MIFLNFTKVLQDIFKDILLLLGERPPIVRTFSGLVQGYWAESVKGRPYAAFEGIPFAQAPVGDLRFKVFCLNSQFNAEIIYE